MNPKSQIRCSAPALVAALCAAFTAKCENEGCERREPAIILDKVYWTEAGSENRRLSDGEFRKIAESSWSSFSNQVGKPGKISFRGQLDKKEDECALVLEARIDLEDLAMPIEAAVAAMAPVQEVNEAHAFVRKGFDDLIHAVMSLLSLTNADSDGLIKALKSAEPDEQILALKLLGIKKAKESVAAVGDLLGDPRLQVAEAAAEALAQIGDEQAVPVLIGSIKRNDLRSEVRAIEAMGAIGGKEAEAYLEMTSNGHEVPEVRRLSENLLKQLKNN